MEYLDRPETATTERTGVRLWSSLVLDMGVLSKGHLAQIAQGQRALVYRDRDCPRLELTEESQWRTRWRLAPRTLVLIDQNGGIAISRSDRQRAARIYRKLVPESQSIDPWHAMVSDAMAWWFARLLRDDFDHYARLRPSQQYRRSALARRATGMAQLEPSVQTEDPVPPSVVDVMAAASDSSHPDDIALLESLRTLLRRTVRDKPARPTGRRRMVRTIELVIVQVKGANVFHVLSALRQMLREGGVRGSLLAPRTVMNMLDAGLLPLVRHMGGQLALDRDCDQWYREYAQLLQVSETPSLSHLRSFLTLFHRYMTVLGAAPLLRALPGAGPLPPPDARVVHPEELRAALRYVDATAPTERIRLQARFMLVFGFAVPLRPWDYWCIRMADVKADERLTVLIYPRVIDGSGKAPATRRPIDILDRDVATAVLDLHHDRQRKEGALDDELLMGDRRSKDGRHQVTQTQRLVAMALREVTGVPDAGPYDLRHTAVTHEARRLRPSGDGTPSTSDRVTHAQLQGFAGHAARTSTDGYVHLDEDDVAPFIARARPAAWATSESYAAALQRLESVEANLVRLRDPMPAQKMRGQLELGDFSLGQRMGILRDVVAGFRIETLAELEDTQPLVIVTVVRAAVDLAVENHWLRRRLRPRSLPDYCKVLERLRIFDLSAQDAKWHTVFEALRDLAAKGRWHRLLVLCNAWRDCIQARYLSMRNASSAARLVAFLLDDCRIPRHQLAFQVVRSQAKIDPLLDRFQIAERPARPRPGRPAVRLVVCPSSSVAKEAIDRHLSVIGLHWMMSAALHTAQAQDASS
jgi:integrase